MEITLRRIADAYSDCWGQQSSKEERQRVYDRARMLRDKGLIASTQARQQGKTMTFTRADAAAAVIALSANLDGQSWGIIEAINQDLRRIGNTQGKAEYERLINDVEDGVPIYIRLEVRTQPWGHTKAFMGFEDLLTRKAQGEGTRVLLWPVTELAKPVLDILRAG